MDRLDLVLRLTLVFYLVKPLQLWYFKVPVTIICVLGLVSGRSLRSSVLWFLLAYTLMARVMMNAFIVDNHIYLAAYWALAVACALALEGSDDVLAQSARLLVGLTFLFATLWKWPLSPDFASGDFFRFTFLADARFRDFSLLFSGIGPEDYRANREILMTWPRTLETVTLLQPPRLVVLARAAALWTLLHEGLIALCFLGPKTWPTYRARHIALISFSWLTYPFATVFGFGWLLMIMGVAQCAPEMRKTRLFYVLSFLVIFIHQFVPWTTALTSTLEVSS
jgi:hypothetical protein